MKSMLVWRGDHSSSPTFESWRCPCPDWNHLLLSVKTLLDLIKVHTSCNPLASSNKLSPCRSMFCRIRAAESLLLLLFLVSCWCHPWLAISWTSSSWCSCRNRLLEGGCPIWTEQLLFLADSRLRSLGLASASALVPTAHCICCFAVYDTWIVLIRFVQSHNWRLFKIVSRLAHYDTWLSLLSSGLFELRSLMAICSIHEVSHIEIVKIFDNLVSCSLFLCVPMTWVHSWLSLKPTSCLKANWTVIAAMSACLGRSNTRNGVPKWVALLYYRLILSCRSTWIDHPSIALANYWYVMWLLSAMRLCWP